MVGVAVIASIDIRQYRREGSKVTTTSNEETAETAVPPMKWYILKVAFNREDTIRDALAKRIALSEFKDMFGEILVPTEDVVEFTRAGKRKVVKRKLYPGYLMIRMGINDDSWFLVRETPGIGDFTGGAGKPTPMSDAEVERIIKLVYPDAEEEQTLKTTIPFRSGDRVRVKEGNFQNLEGDVDRIDEANGRVTVIISIFGRSTPVELDHWQIETL
jgi:transcription termination/antitermination protein NusG